VTAREIVASVLMVPGTVLVLVAAVGVYRLPDVFARLHAATKAATLGFALIAVGGAVALGDAASVTKLLLAIVCIAVTAPAGAHLVGRAAYRSGTELSDQTVVDEIPPTHLTRIRSKQST
jgi:multicomponent Na+:H+ antiporter subunit G